MILENRNDFGDLFRVDTGAHQSRRNSRAQRNVSSQMRKISSEKCYWEPGAWLGVSQTVYHFFLGNMKVGNVKFFFNFREFFTFEINFFYDRSALVFDSDLVIYNRISLLLKIRQIPTSKEILL